MSLVQHYIDTDYPVFRSGEKALDVLARLEELELREAPVLKDDRLLAIVCPEDLRQALDVAGGKSAGLSVDRLKVDAPESVLSGDHILDIFHCLCRDRSRNLLPVANEDGSFAGVALKRRLLDDIAERFHFAGRGTTLEIEAPALGVKVSEIVSVLEKNDAMVLSFGITAPEPGASSMLVTFRLQTTDIFRLVKTLEKYGYTIRYAHPSADGGEDELREKALEFMRYIDM